MHTLSELPSPRIGFNAASGNFTNLHPNALAELHALFPAVNVALEMTRAECAMLCSPRLRKHPGRTLERAVERAQQLVEGKAAA